MISSVNSFIETAESLNTHQQRLVNSGLTSQPPITSRNDQKFGTVELSSSCVSIEPLSVSQEKVRRYLTTETRTGSGVFLLRVVLWK
jgi:hypothetical protein